MCRADRIDGDIDVLHILFETRRLHVNDLVRPKSTDVIHIVREGGGNDFSSDSLRKLDRLSYPVSCGPAGETRLELRRTSCRTKLSHCMIERSVLIESVEEA